MLPRPALSLNIKDLKDVKGEPVTEGTHKVVVVTFQDTDGTTKRAYKKSCSPDYYPPLSAKYVVAFSTLVRAALGDRASEDRLVYNDAGEIVATVSIEIPNFVPLLKLLRKYDDPEKEKMGCPTKQMLIAENMAELLMSAYIHKNNDLHPDNLSLKGMIDLDEIYPELTLLPKGYPPLLFVLTEQDIRIFPIIYRKHWPANYIPKNWNIAKTYKTGAFAELQGDKEFIYQYFTAILKELLAFDKDMLKKRMNLVLGDETLSLSTLSSQKRTELLNFNGSKLYYDGQKNERRFVEHVMLFLEQEHIKFRNLVLNMPEFKDFLEILNKDPAKTLEIKEWFIKQNKKNIVPYNLNFIDTELHALWRDCFKKELAKEMKHFDIDIKQLITTSHLNKNNAAKDEMSYEQLDAIITSLIKPDDSEESKTTRVHNLQIEPEKTLLLNNELFLKIKTQATDLFESVTQLINQYQEKTTATIEDNHAFIENVKKVIATNINSRNQLSKWLEENKAKSKELELDVLQNPIYIMSEFSYYTKKFIKETENTLKNFYMNPIIVQLLPPITNKKPDYSDELKMTPHSSRSFTSVTDNAKNSPFLALAKPCNTDDLRIIHTNTTIVLYLSMHLKDWVTPDKNTLIKKLIKEVHMQDYDMRNKYPITGAFYNMFRKRTSEEIYNMPLTEILSDPISSWNSTSLNTLIIKKLCLTLLELEKHDPYTKTVYDRIIAITKNDDNWWSTVALEIAEKSNLKKSLNAATEQTIEKANAH